MNESDVLGRYQWSYRLLLLFAPDPDHESYVTQKTLLESEAAAFEERDLLIFDLFQVAGRVGPQALSPQAISNLRKRYVDPDDDFVLLLIGKDGTVKLRRNEACSPAELYTLIDAMPMRQREIEQG
ncbi:MAG: DUF4174 domain-containing protein [Trueperaceae bacterium]|nr:MAG: DUF4174 domain-containing protein [Trueperaceae bacterium]